MHAEASSRVPPAVEWAREVTPGRPEVWLIGGSGDVGRRTAAILAREYRRTVVIAARDGPRAATIAAELGPRARVETLDAGRPEAAGRIHAGADAINLTEATDPSLARAIVDRGGCFVESSASTEYVGQIRLATGGSIHGLAIVNAGLAPGMTNLMASAIKAETPSTDAIDIVVELGMGRHHGRAATEWTLRNAGIGYPLRLSGADVVRTPGALRRRVHFSGDRRARPAIGFGFCDQAAIAENLALSQVCTYLALNPAIVTRVLSFALRLGLGPWIGRHARALTRVLARGPAFGPTGTRVQVRGWDHAGRETGVLELHTTDQASATASILCQAVEAGGSHPGTGVLDLDRVTSVVPVVARLRHDFPDTRWVDMGTSDAPGPRSRPAGV